MISLSFSSVRCLIQLPLLSALSAQLLFSLLLVVVVRVVAHRGNQSSRTQAGLDLYPKLRDVLKLVVKVNFFASYDCTYSSPSYQLDHVLHKTIISTIDGSVYRSTFLTGLCWKASACVSTSDHIIVRK